MSPQPLDLLKVLDRFQADRSTPTHEQCLQAFRLMSQGRVLESHNRARAAMRDSLLRNDYGDRAIACATLAAVSASQGNFEEATHQAQDCYRIYHQSQDEHNEAVALALLATIYQMHLERLSQDVTLPLIEARARSKSIEANALSKGEVEDAAKYRRQFIEFGEHVRRARWITAIPYALPLVWLPAIDLNPPNSSEGYMEPVLFTLRTRQEAATEEAGDNDPGEIVDVLYTARPVPGQGGGSGELLRPPLLDPGAVYIAVKIDPATAGEPGFQDDDYWLLRSNDPNQLIGQIERAGGNLAGMEFKRANDGHFQFRFVSPQDTSGAQVPMITLTVDAILRRVP